MFSNDPRLADLAAWDPITDPGPPPPASVFFFFCSVPPVRARWIHSPAVDLLLATCWIPFAVAAHWTADDRSMIGTVLVATFTLSFAHQPLTLPIVYGDPEERAARRRLYTWCPVVFLVAAVGGLAVSVAVVAIVAGLWNAEHTLMQRYGITRIYARKAGSPTSGRPGSRRPCSSGGLVLAAVVAAASAGTEAQLLDLPLGTVNHEGLRDPRRPAAGGPVGAAGRGGGRGRRDRPGGWPPRPDAGGRRRRQRRQAALRRGDRRADRRDAGRPASPGSSATSVPTPSSTS